MGYLKKEQRKVRHKQQKRSLKEIINEIQANLKDFS